MWILWNVSARKCLHTLLNCLWELGLLFFIRIWWNSYRYMQYRSSLKTSSLLIMINVMWIDIMTLYTNDFSLHYITLYLLLSFKSMIYSLVREHDYFNHSKRTWFPFILMLSDRNKIGLKYQPGCFADLHYLLTW